MIKFIIFFRKPADISVFEEKFSNHVRLINAMPNLRRTVVNRVISAPRGEPAYYLIHEAFFEDMPALNYALNSPEGRAAGADLLGWARDLTTMLYAEVWGEDFAPAPTPPVAGEAAPAVAEVEAAPVPPEPEPAPVSELMPEPAPITETIGDPAAQAAQAAVQAIFGANNAADAAPPDAPEIIPS